MAGGGCVGRGKESENGRGPRERDWDGEMRVRAMCTFQCDLHVQSLVSSACSIRIYIHL